MEAGKPLRGGGGGGLGRKTEKAQSNMLGLLAGIPRKRNETKKKWLTFLRTQNSVRSTEGGFLEGTLSL